MPGRLQVDLLGAADRGVNSKTSMVAPPGNRIQPIFSPGVGVVDAEEELQSRGVVVAVHADEGAPKTSQ